MTRVHCGLCVCELINIIMKPKPIVRAEQDTTRHNYENWNPRAVREPPGVVACRSCGSLHFEKVWHKKGARLPLRLRGTRTERRTLCPACRMSMCGTHGGIVTIIGVPEKLRGEAVRIMLASAKFSEDQDCQHRIISLSENDGTLVATTTEGHMAVRMAQRVRDALKNARLDVRIAFSGEPYDTIRVSAIYHATSGGCQEFPRLSRKILHNI